VCDRDNLNDAPDSSSKKHQAD